MTAVLHPSAPHELPSFIVGPGETDVLMVGTLVFLLGTVLGIGVLYFKLHALPEHIAHNGDKAQFQIAAVLALLALFTHNHLFWIGALLLAMVRFPDFTTPLNGIAASVARIADANGRSPTAGSPAFPHQAADQAGQMPGSREAHDV